MATREPDGYRRLLAGSFWLTVNLSVAAATGFVFWLLAARLHDRQSLGIASSLFASVAFVNYATSLGLPPTIIKYSDEGSAAWRSLYSWALVVSGLASVVGAVVYLAIIDFPGASAVEPFGLPALGVFAATVLGFSLSYLVDLRLIAARRYGLVVGKSLVIGLGRIAMLALPIGGSASAAIFLASVVPVGISAALFIAFWSSSRPAALALAPIPRRMNDVLRFSGINYVAGLASGAPLFALPVVVLANVEPAAYATFFVGWTVASIVFLVPAAISQSLLVEGSRDTGALGRKAILGLAMSVGLMVIAVAVAIGAPGLVTLAFGSSYEAGGPILTGLVLAAIPWAVTSIALSVARVRRDHVAIIAMTITLGGVVLVVAMLRTPAAGVGGAIEAWVIGHFSAAVVGAAYLLTRPIGSLDAKPVRT